MNHPITIRGELDGCPIIEHYSDHVSATRAALDLCKRFPSATWRLVDPATGALRAMCRNYRFFGVIHNGAPQ